MTQIATNDGSPSEMSGLNELPTTELKTRLAQAITVTARGLYETAVIFTELQRRGENVDDLRLSLAPYLPRIARGEVAAEAVIALAGFKTALDRIARMPIAQQKSIINQRINIATDTGSTQPVIMSRRLVDMSAREVRTAITEDGRVLQPEAQIEVARLTASRDGNKKRAVPLGRPPRIYIRGEHIYVGKHVMRADYLVSQLRDLGLLK